MSFDFDQGHTFYSLYNLSLKSLFHSPLIIFFTFITTKATKFSNKHVYVLVTPCLQCTCLFFLQKKKVGIQYQTSIINLCTEQQIKYVLTNAISSNLFAAIPTFQRAVFTVSIIYTRGLSVNCPIE